MTDQTALEGGKRTARLPATLDNASSRLLPTPRVNLKTLDGVRLEMSKVYRQMKMGHLDGADGTKRAYVLSLVGKLIEASDLAERIEVLEEQIRGR